MSNAPEDPAPIDPQYDPYVASEATASQIDKDARMWAMVCHLSALLQFAGPTVLSIIGPLVVWLIKRDEHPFIDDQGKESLNFQISMTIYTWAITILLLVTCVGAVLLIAVIPILILVDVILVVVASLKANDGIAYRYPLTIRFLK